MHLNEEATLVLNHSPTFVPTDPCLYDSDPLSEQIHYLMKHRWWGWKETRDALIKTELLGDRNAIILTALAHPHSCHPSSVQPGPKKRKKKKWY